MSTAFNDEAILDWLLSFSVFIEILMSSLEISPSSWFVDSVFPSKGVFKNKLAPKQGSQTEGNFIFLKQVFNHQACIYAPFL